MIDNCDTTAQKWFEVVSGTLRTSTSYGGFYGADYAYLPVTSGAETERVRWSTAALPAGEYEVYAWWSAAKTRSKSAPFVIRDGEAVLAEVRVNQTVNGGSWQRLGGTFTFSAGQHTVELHNGASKTPSSTAVCADAVRLSARAAPQPARRPRRRPHRRPPRQPPPVRPRHSQPRPQPRLP